MCSSKWSHFKVEGEKGPRKAFKYSQYQIIIIIIII